MDLLVFSASELTDDEAGGHGDRWGVFDDDTSALIGRWLGVAIEKAEVPMLGICDMAGTEQVLAHGEPPAFAMLYTGQKAGTSNAGLMSLVRTDGGGPGREPGNLPCSFFPFLGDGVAVEAEIEQISLFPNRVEARLALSLAAGCAIDVFDSCFYLSRSAYRIGERYRFVVSALAYRMGPAPALEHVIDDEHEIRRFRARRAWVQTHGEWTPDDEQACLAAWQPESPGDLEPIRIHTGEAAALLPLSSGPEDNVQFQGEVVHVTPRAARILDEHFWRVDTVVMRGEEEDLILPIYVAERLFESEWRPEAGQYVSGTLWLQAYASSRVGGPGEHTPE